MDAEDEVVVVAGLTCGDWRLFDARKGSAEIGANRVADNLMSGVD